MKRASVIGTPISHSLSPLIFELMSLNESSPLVYSRHEVKPEGLALFLKRLREDPEQLGVNVTIPLKERVIENLDEVEPSAEAIGAVNVIRNEGGRLHGYNTDVIGIERTLAQNNFNSKERNCFLWGAGGSAKAVAYVLGSQKAKTVVIYNPRSSRGQELADHFNRLFPATHFMSIAAVTEVRSIEFSLVVNSTPVGMKEPFDESFFDSISSLVFSKDALAFDLIYTPAETLFMKKSKQAGLNAVGGLNMLIGQAIATWGLWVAPVEDWNKLERFMVPYLRGALLLRESEKSLFLTGFMGVGKSSVGRTLAELMGRHFIDTDYQIEKSAQKTISEIFEQDGEEKFRRLEKEAIATLLHGQKSIVALGGGALLNEETRSRVLEEGILVHLTADPESLDERISRQSWKRPLMAGLTSEERLLKIQEMMKTRGPIYRQAHFEVATDTHQQIRIALDILHQLGVSHEKRN